MPLISPAKRSLMDLIVPFDALNDLGHSHTPSTRCCSEGSPSPLEVMLSDEAGSPPDQLLRKVVWHLLSGPQRTLREEAWRERRCAVFSQSRFSIGVRLVVFPFAVPIPAAQPP